MSERYYFRLLDHPQMLGPETLSAIEAHTKGIHDRYEAVPAGGQTYAQLQKSKDWVRIDSLLSSVLGKVALPTISAPTQPDVGVEQRNLGSNSLVARRWEYKCLELPTGFFGGSKPGKWDAYLNSFGAEGWELVSVATETSIHGGTGGSKSFVATLKRPL